MSNPFPDAIDSFDVDQVVAAIATGFDVNAPFDHEDLGEGLTPLWLAADRNELDMVERLLAAGADPNRPTREPPHFRTYQVDIVRLLLDAGARLDARDGDGHDLLMHCAGKKPAHGSYYAPIAHLALERGIDRHATDSEGRTALEIALAGQNWEVAREIHGPRLVTGEYANPLEEAIAIQDDTWAEDEAARVDVAARYDSEAFGAGILPLHAACSGNHPAAVRALLARGADASARDGEGTPALLLTASADVARLLLDAGADVGACDAQGRNLLMRAAASEQYNEEFVAIAQLAFAGGVDMRVRDATGATALAIALKNHGKKIAALIRGPVKLPKLLQEISATLLHGEAVPPLLAALWGEHFKAGECFLSPLGEATLAADPAELGLESYLDGDPAWRRLFAELAFFATEADGAALALWRHRPELALAEAPVIILDNEGSLRRGAPCLADYLALGYGEAEGRAGLTKARKWLKKQGIDHKATVEELQAARDALPDPEARLRGLG